METTTTTTNSHLTATYSLEDNKLRPYSRVRLDRKTFDLLKSHGLRYAPRQKLFVAPMWTPVRAKILKELCGHIEDEQMTLEERAEVRAERFTGYQEKRKHDSELAYNRVKEISSHIPMGQPILVGHHSEKRARREAKRIELGMHKACQMWESSKYWERKAKDAIRHATYKDRPKVRVRRIKKLEAEKRKFERKIEESKKFSFLWTHLGKELTLERAKSIANYDRTMATFPLNDYPRGEDKSHEGPLSLWDALDFITPEQAQTIAVARHKKTIAFYTEWVNHTLLRLNYERTLLDAQGYKEPEKKKRPKLPSIVNYPEEGFKHMTKEEWSARSQACKGIYTQDSEQEFTPYRCRQIVGKGLSLNRVFITNQKIVRPLKKESLR